MSHGKHTGKGVVHIKRKFQDKKRKTQLGPHIKGRLVDEIGMARTKKLTKLTQLAITQVIGYLEIDLQVFYILKL